MLRPLVALAIVLTAVPAVAAPPHFDVLSLEPTGRETEDGALPAGEIILHRETRLGLPTFVWAAFAPRTAGGPPASWEAAALSHVQRHAGVYRLSGRDLEDLQVQAVHDLGRGPIIVALRRDIGQVPVFRDELRVAMDRNGDLLGITGYLPGGDPVATDWKMPAEEALARAAADLGAVFGADAFRPAGRDAGGFARFAAEGLGREARIRQVYFHLPDRLLPAWHLELQIDQDWMAWVVDATEGGVLWRKSLVQHAHDYRVWAGGDAHPYDGPQGFVGTPHPTGFPNGFQAPVVSRQLHSLAHGPISTGDPWLPAGTVQTVGNNVDAYLDENWPDGLGGDHRGVISGPGGFDWEWDPDLPPDATDDQKMASVIQLFYTTNWLHDWYYDAGFDEAWRNAQQDNYGRGGAENDRLLAEAQDFWGRDNATMGTPADGDHPVMSMFLFTGRFSRYLDVELSDGETHRYGVGLASFGPTHFDVTGPLVVADDGVGAPTDACQPLVGDYTGAVVLVDRGICPFAEKAKRVQDAGGVGIIIANNVGGQAPGMSGDDDGHTVAVVSVRIEDGTELRKTPGAQVRLYREFAVDRDSAQDTSIVAHEFTHMVTTRLIGNAAGLGNNQGGSMGEGWSDFASLLFLVREDDALIPGNEDFRGTYAIGGWVSSGGGNDGYYYGMRRFPYSADFARNPLTFRHVQRGVELPEGAPLAWGRNGRWNAQVHSSGEVWATLLWEAFVSLLDDRDTASFEETRQLMLEMLVASFKLTPTDPTFLEARDALLLAAYGYDEAHYATLWQAFARRGAGIDAVAPDRWSEDHAGVVESFEAGNGLKILHANVVGDDCDGDGILDEGETATFRVRLRNVGILPLPQARMLVSTDTPGLQLDVSDVAIPPSNPFEEVEVEIPIALGQDAGIDRFELTITLRDGRGGEDRVFSWGALAHRDLKPAATLIDRAELERSVWQVEGSSSSPAHGVWERVHVAGEGWHWRGPAPGARSDQWLLSPPLQVSATEPFRIDFRHRYNFEQIQGEAIDGSRLEISVDGGAWRPVPLDYPARVYFLLDNPLRSEAVYSGRNGDWPSFEFVRADLGQEYAGKAVRLRFRVGAAPMGASSGWEIDDITFSGIENLPFPMAVPETGSCENQAPVAVIVASDGLPESSEVQVDGSASYDPDWDELHFAWTQLEGPEVEWLDAGSVQARFRTPEVAVDQAIVLRLEVTDGELFGETTRSILILDSNRPPVAEVVTPVEVNPGGRATLDGSASSDPEGAALDFLWSQLEGPEVVLDDSTSATPSFTAPDEEVRLRFSLVVSDGVHQSAPAEVVVAVGNRAPVVETAGTITVDERSRTVLEAIGSDPDGDELVYRWEQVEGVAATLEIDDDGNTVLVAPDVEGEEVLVLSVVASDGVLESEPALLEVVVRDVNRLPIVALAPQVHVETGRLVVLDASASEDPDGEELTFRWKQVDGPEVHLGPLDVPVLRFTAPFEPAVLAFEVEVIDARGGTATADVLVRVSDSSAGGGCGCSSGDGAGAVQILGFLAVAWAFTRRRSAA